MDLSQLQWHWNAMGEDDPLFAILTSPGKQNRQWDPAEFFRTGQWEINVLMEQIRATGFPLRTGRALDFGCGVGRMTQPLCEVFEECYGVDIAPSMIEEAERYNRYGSRCHYVVNAADHLALFQDASFDFIYSNIVLQHMRPEYSTRYIEEFVRLLVPGGLAVFQIPSDRAAPAVDVSAPEASAPEASASEASASEASASEASAPEASAPEASASERAEGMSGMPDTAFRAEIHALDRELTGAPGSGHALRVNVRNASEITWPRNTTESGRFEIRLGTHWYDQHWNMLDREDDRQPLPNAVQPGDVTHVDMVVHMPAEQGEYFLAFDLVQEGVTWFGEKSTTPDIIRVRVAAANQQSGETTMPAPHMETRHVPAISEPRMEMHCVPTEHVLEIVERAGCTLIARLDDRYAPSYVSYRYFVAKPS